MDRRILVTVAVVAIALIGWFGLRHLRDAGNPGGGVDSAEPAAIDETVGESPRAHNEATPDRWTTQRRLRQRPVGVDNRIPDLDFGDEPFPDEDEEQAMRDTEAELEASDPWPADYDGINGAIGEVLGDIRECYQEWLNLVPDLEGKVVVRFVIEGQDETGVVTEAEVVEATTAENTFFEGCLLNVMSDLQFEDPDGQMTVNYPFVFRAE